MEKVFTYQGKEIVCRFEVERGPQSFPKIILVEVLGTSYRKSDFYLSDGQWIYNITPLTSGNKMPYPEVIPTELNNQIHDYIKDYFHSKSLAQPIPQLIDELLVKLMEGYSNICDLKDQAVSIGYLNTSQRAMLIGERLKIALVNRGFTNLQFGYIDEMHEIPDDDLIVKNSDNKLLHWVYITLHDQLPLAQ